MLLKLEVFRSKEKTITKHIPMSSYDAVKVELAMDSLREALDSESTYAALMLAFNPFKSKV